MPSYLLQPLDWPMPTPTWYITPYATVEFYPVRNTSNVQATPKPTQWRPTIEEENKAPPPHKTVVYDILNISMTMEEHDSAIKVALQKKVTMRKETELQDDIGKKITNLVKPQNAALVHPAADLLESYTTESCPKIADYIVQ